MGSWSKGLKLAGREGKHGWCTNQASKSLYHDPFSAYSAVESPKSTLFHNNANVTRSGNLHKLLKMRKHNTEVEKKERIKRLKRKENNTPPPPPPPPPKKKKKKKKKK